jgi:mannosidase alpha-like ER degradation enhancer 2
VFDPESRFMRGRTAEGTWREPFDPLLADHRIHTDYTEGNAWQHLWFVPHDVQGLIDAMGGEEIFLARLDSLFGIDSTLHGERISPDITGMIGQYAHGNEPSHHIAYLYSYAGAPSRTAERVRGILDTQYDDTPFGLSGNEDCGQMSAWYVLSALGFYPVNPAEGTYVLGSPLFPEARMAVGDERWFTVRARGSSGENRYIQSARLNGKPYDLAYLLHEDVAAGGVLELMMGPEPSAWATGPEARPPSMSSPARVPMATAAPATVDAPPLPLDVLPADEVADRVSEEFLHAWRGYVRHAWGHDALRPLSRSGHDWYGTSLYMTPVDAFDTMLLMGLEEEAGEAKELVLESLSFDRDLSVQVFEVTIRLLGGLITAYQWDGHPRFLELARDLADRLLPAFDSDTGMPYRMVHLRTGERSGPVNNPAEIGTLMLEFGSLSKLTGDPTYYETAKRAVVALFQRRSGIGLVGTTIDVETGEWQDRTSHVSGRIDSYYEYLLKAWLLFRDPDFRRMWEESIRSVNRYLADERPDGLWYGHVDMDTGERTATHFGALDAFLPAVLALGGDVERARALMESVYRMWTAFGIEPERLDYVTMDAIDPAYPLRPEALESAFYLYRLTGDERYQTMGRTMFAALVEGARTDTGFAHLVDVRSGEKADAMESFFLAETLKYAFLLFSSDEVLDLSEVVFNTEAHPIRRTWE